MNRIRVVSLEDYDRVGGHCRLFCPCRVELSELANVDLAHDRRADQRLPPLFEDVDHLACLRGERVDFGGFVVEVGHNLALER